jgi:hypothetical protein
VLVSLALLGPSEKQKEPQPPKVPDPPVFHLRDGGKVAGRPKLDVLTVDTRYGVLHVPTEDLILVRFARRLADLERQRIEAAIARLGAEDFADREAATEDLRKMGLVARKFLLEARKGAIDEVKSRAASLLAEISSSAPTPSSSEEDGLDPLLDDEDDEVVTQRFTVRGRVKEEQFTVESRYGALELEATEIAGIAFHPEKRTVRTLEVSASSTVPDSWLNTKLSVAKGQRIVLRARGQITVPNYNLTSGPEGTTRYSGSTFQNFPMLSLVGKVGKNGKPFLVAKEYQGKASREGTLYLALVPFRRNYAASGSYQVKVETGQSGELEPAPGTEGDEGKR